VVQRNCLKQRDRLIQIWNLAVNAQLEHERKRFYNRAINYAKVNFIEVGNAIYALFSLILNMCITNTEKRFCRYATSALRNEFSSLVLVSCQKLLLKKRKTFLSTRKMRHGTHTSHCASVHEDHFSNSGYPLDHFCISNVFNSLFKIIPACVAAQRRKHIKRTKLVHFALLHIATHCYPRAWIKPEHFFISWPKPNPNSKSPARLQTLDCSPLNDPCKKGHIFDKLLSIFEKLIFDYF